MQTHPLPSLADVPSSALTERLYQIRRQERELLVEFLAYLNEVERRRVDRELGFSSVFVFLTDYLGYSRAAAFRRSTAARLLERFPLVAGYLADGRLGLTTLVELRGVLAPDTLTQTLDRAAGRTEEQVKELVAALRPRPEPMDLLRRLPTSSPPTPCPTPTTPPPSPRAPEPPRLTPISEDRRVLRVTVDRAFVDDLTDVRSALSHQIPDGDLEKILHHCLRVTLREHRRRRQARTDKPRSPAPTTHEGRHVPAAVRRAVFERDEGKCTFVGITGHRCGSTYQVEIHHRQPYARGGPATVENLALLCSRHNAYQAELDFGAEKMAAIRHGLASECQ